METIRKSGDPAVWHADDSVPAPSANGRHSRQRPDQVTGHA